MYVDATVLRQYWYMHSIASQHNGKSHFSTLTFSLF